MCAEDDRSAAEVADKTTGRAWSLDGSQAIILGVGIFVLLDVFAALTLPYDTWHYAAWPAVAAVALSGKVALLAYFIAERSRRAWHERHYQALIRIRAERERRTKRWGGE